MSVQAKQKKIRPPLLLCSLLFLAACSNLYSNGQTGEHATKQTDQQFAIKQAELAREAELTVVLNQLHRKEYLPAEAALRALLEKTSEPADNVQLKVALLLLYLDRKSPLYNIDTATQLLDQLFKLYNTGAHTHAQQLQFHSLHVLLQQNISTESEIAQRQQERRIRLRRESQIRALERALKKLRNLSLH